MSTLFVSAVTTQPVTGTYLSSEDPTDTQHGGHIRVRYLQDTQEDARFAAGLLVEAFRGKFIHAVSEKRLKTMVDILTSSNRGKSDIFYSRNLVAEYQGRLAGLATIKLPGDTDESSTEQVCDLGCYRVCRLMCFDCVTNESPERNGCYLDHICVDSEFRGKGIGKVLMQHAEHQAHQLNCHFIYLYVVTTNRAQHLYEREGYHVTNTTSCCGCMNCLLGEPAVHRMDKKL